MKDRKAASRRYYQSHKEERRAYNAAYRAANKQKIRARDRAYSKLHKDKLSAYGKAYKKANHQKLKLANRFYHLKKKYGLTAIDYFNLCESQNDCCAICGRVRKLYVDHNHGTNKVRALLCNNCNTALGNFDENPKLLQKAKDYLTTG